MDNRAGTKDLSVGFNSKLLETDPKIGPVSMPTLAFALVAWAAIPSTADAEGVSCNLSVCNVTTATQGATGSAAGNGGNGGIGSQGGNGAQGGTVLSV